MSSGTRGRGVRLLAIGIVLLCAVVATAGSGSDSGLGSKKANGDVSAPTIVRKGSGDTATVYGQVTVKNSSSKASDYLISAVAESADGKTRYGETIVTIHSLDPGQTTTDKGIFTKDIPQGAHLRVKTVQRTKAI